MSPACLRSLFLSIAASGLLLGCQMAPRTELAAPMASTAQITAVTPDTTQALRAGDHVRLEVKVGHAVAADSGTLTLIALSADNTTVARDDKVVPKGQGNTILTAEFTVPNTTVIRVFTSLVVKGQESTSAVDGRAFEVRAR